MVGFERVFRSRPTQGFRGLALVVAVPALLAAQPAIHEGGVVSAADYARGGLPARALAPGSIGVIFGENLAAVTAVAGGPPLPFELGGTTVTVEGRPAALFFVSPTQINFQVPVFDLTLPTAVGPYPYELQVTTPDGAAVSTAPLAGSAPKLFSADGSGCGQALAFNVAQDGSLTLNSPRNAAEPSQWIRVYGTGLGNLDFQGRSLPDGEAAPPDARVHNNLGGALVIDRHADLRAAALFDDPVDGGALAIPFRGRAEGLVGVDEYRMRLPVLVRSGCRVPIELWSRRLAYSQTLSIAVQQGGGVCAPETPESIVEARWLKRTFHSRQGRTEEEALRLRAVRYPNGSLTAHPEEPGRGDAFPPPPFSCPGFAGDALNLGALSITAPAGPEHDAATPLPQPRNTIPLPAGSFSDGPARVAWTGGEDAEAAASSVEIPRPIRILSEHPPKTSIAINGSVTIDWEGGGSGARVRVRLLRCRDNQAIEWSTPAEAGTTTYLIGPYSWDTDVLQVIHEPDPDQASELSPERAEVPGLTGGLIHDWRQEEVFLFSPSSDPDYAERYCSRAFSLWY